MPPSGHSGFGTNRFPVRGVAVALVILATVGCGSARPVGRVAVPAGSRSADQRAAAIYSAVIRELVTKDNTFGSAPRSVKVIYVLDHPIEGAGDPEARATTRSSQEGFSEALKMAIRARLAELFPVKFVPSRSSAVVGEEAGASPGHVRAGGVLITLGPIVEKEGDVRVGNSWWMNGLAGQWSTYVLGERGAGWKVTGLSGPIAIS